MSQNWDKIRVNITNNLNSSGLTASSQHAAEGEFVDNPGNIPANSSAAPGTGTFKAQSYGGNTWSGVKGTVVYSLSDGTQMNVSFYVSFYDGPLNGSYYDVGFLGANASKYTNLTNTQDHKKTLGGNGK